MIILNEREYIEQIMKQQGAIENVVHVAHKLAKYYWQDEDSATVVYNKVIDFLKSRNPYFNEVKYSKLIKAAVKKQKGKMIIEIPFIPITQHELDMINSICCENVKITKGAQRVAFTLLCLAKYNNMIYPTNSNWVSNSHTEIFSLANLRCNTTEKYTMINLILKLGLIDMPRKLTNNSFNVKFVDNVGEPVLEIDDFRSLGNQYLAYLGFNYGACIYCGEYIMAHKGKQLICTACKKDPPYMYKFITCKECGCEVKVKRIVKKQEYCPECYKKHRRLQQCLNKRIERERRMSTVLTNTNI